MFFDTETLTLTLAFLARTWRTRGFKHPAIQTDDAAVAFERGARFDRKLVGVKLISASVHTGASRVG